MNQFCLSSDGIYLLNFFIFSNSMRNFLVQNIMKVRQIYILRELKDPIYTIKQHFLILRSPLLQKYIEEYIYS